MIMIDHCVRMLVGHLVKHLDCPAMTFIVTTNLDRVYDLTCDVNFMHLYVSSIYVCSMVAERLSHPGYRSDAHEAHLAHEV